MASQRPIFSINVLPLIIIIDQSLNKELQQFYNCVPIYFVINYINKPNNNHITS